MSNREWISDKSYTVQEETPVSHGLPTPIEHLHGFIASLEEDAAWAQEQINRGYTEIGRQSARKESALARIAETRALLASLQPATTEGAH